MTNIEDKGPDVSACVYFSFCLSGLSFLPPKKKMLEVIESDRKRNSGRSGDLEEDPSHVLVGS